MSDLTPEALAELRRLAEACPMPDSDPDTLERWYKLEDLTERNYPIPPIDAAFIAAASPDVVLGLLDRLLHYEGEACDNARAEVERLTARLEDVEGALVELQPDPVLVEGSWIPFRDLATVCGNFMRSSAEHARAAKAAHVRVAELEAAVERVRATAEHYDGLSYAGCAAAILRALDGEADRG